MAVVAVTGAGGLVGRHLVPELIAQGHRVRALARPASRGSYAQGVEIVRGDVRNRQAVTALVEGAEAVIHLAAGFSPLDDLPGIIVEGTQSVVKAAEEAGVQRLVFMSCLGAEAAAPSFCAAKWKAETAVRSSEVPFVILRPSLILGPDDGICRPLADLIRTLPATPVPGQGQQRMQPVDVGDVARCALRAMESEDLVGETADVGGASYLTFRQLVDLVSGCLGVVKPKLLLPPDWLSRLAPILPASARGLFTPPRLSLYRHGVVASPGAVQRAFGFEPVSILDRLPGYIS